MNEKLAIEALKQLKEVFDRHGIEFWLDTGTLLGAVRDGKIIPWDYDIDLSMLSKNFYKINDIIPELGEQGFWVRFKKRNTSGGGVYTLTIAKGDVKIIVCSMQKDKDKTWTEWMQGGSYILREIYSIFTLENVYLPKKISFGKGMGISTGNQLKMFSRISIVPYKLIKILPDKLKQIFSNFFLFLWIKSGAKRTFISIPSKHFNELKQIKFYGKNFLVPAKTEEYLAYRYGKDWKIPRKNYVWYEEDGAIYRQ